ncbi:hypothetical protein BSKO_06472 [Bryopsis sp. KO-2023]|nr:hypothetical protein BSKO_06472 [Bryopsis sp. KO-2023]
MSFSSTTSSVFLFLSLILLSDFYPIQSTVTPNSFGYYYFARQWPPGMCVHSDCGQHIPRQFMVHGLWPSRTTYCNSSALFNPSEIEDLRPELEKIWPSLSGDTAPTELWRVAWEKYGTCFSESQHDYFSLVIQLHKTYSLLEPLSSWQVMPSDYEMYSRWELEESVGHSFGAEPIILCKGKQQKYVTEIWMCLNLNFDPVACPRETSHACTTVRLPKHTRRMVPVWKIIVGSLTLAVFGAMMFIHRRPCHPTRRATATDDHEQPLLETEDM